MIDTQAIGFALEQYVEACKVRDLSEDRIKDIVADLNHEERIILVADVYESDAPLRVGDVTNLGIWSDVHPHELVRELANRFETSEA